MRESATTMPADHEQRVAALDPARSFIVQAPAGSGKTELLIQRYLSLLAIVDEPEEILAVTFTRKAAAEMRGRILRAIRDTAAPTQLQQTASLAKAVAVRNRERGWRLDEHPARIRISTIDAVNASIAAESPLAAGTLGLGPITDDPALLYQDAARRVLARVEDPGPLGNRVQRLLLHLDNRADRFERLLAAMLAKRDQWLPLTGSGEHSGEARAWLEQGLTQIVEHGLRELADALPRRCHDELVELMSIAGHAIAADQPEHRLTEWAGLESLPEATVDRLAAWQAMTAVCLTNQGTWRRRLTKEQGFYPGEKTPKERALELLEELSAVPGLGGLFAEVLLSPIPRYADEQWEILSDLLEILPLAAAELTVVFHQRRETDYPEVAAEALRALGQAGTPTELALAMDHRFRHILVDEFQDTSRQQFELLERLTEGWEDGDGRTLFVVGDPMQSIYRFRQAEVGLFLQVKQSGLGMIMPESLQLSANFRSDPALVDWVNQTFGQVLPDEDDPLTGAVEFAAATAARSHDTSSGVCLYADDSMDPAIEAAGVVSVVQESLMQWPEERIAILVRSRSHARALIPALDAAGVQYSGADLEYLADVSVVQDLVALTRALTHAADRIAWLAILRAPWCGLSLDDLHRLAGTDHARTVWSLVNDATVVRQLSEDGQVRLRTTQAAMENSLVGRSRMPLRDLVEGAWQALGGPATLDGPGDLERAERYLEYLDTIDRGGDCDDGARLPQEIPKLKTPETGPRPVVELMTMHGAKGLEFDSVIVPGLGRVTKSDDKPVLSWKEVVSGPTGQALLLAPIERAGAEDDSINALIRRLDRQQNECEQDRLLYVAVTRARRRLHLFAQLSAANEDTAGHWERPRRGTLAFRLWAALGTDFERIESLSARPATRVSGWVQSPLRRLVSDWAHPGAPPSCVVASHAEDQSDEKISFDWAGPAAMHVGSVVHLWLQHIANTGSEPRIDDLRPAFRRMLLLLGVAATEIEAATGRVADALSRTLDDETGRWLVSNDHVEADSELEVTYLDGDTMRRIIIDRTIVTDNGDRWIIDYKTSVHEGADLEGFLQHEVDRYRPQLQRYKDAITQLDSRPVRTALYFPLLSAFREVVMD